MDDATGRNFEIEIEEADRLDSALIRTLIEIDLQTFAEPTFSPYTAAAFLQSGRVFLLRADEAVIGTCVCMRAWERPGEANILSMGIRPGWRGRGLGQRFMALVLERLDVKGMRSASLLVGADNRRAIKVYSDVGFEVVRTVDGDPRTGSQLVLMRKQLQVSEEARLIPLKS